MKQEWRLQGKDTKAGFVTLSPVAHLVFSSLEAVNPSPRPYSQPSTREGSSSGLACWPPWIRELERSSGWSRLCRERGEEGVAHTSLAQVP